MKANEIVGTIFPPEAGTKLADTLLDRADIDWADLAIDLRECSAGMLISAFFNGFLQRVADRRPSLLDSARHVDWETAFPFQSQSIQRWMRDFAPVDPLSTTRPAHR